MRYILISKETAAEYGIAERGHKSVTDGIIINEKEADNHPRLAHLATYEERVQALGGEALTDAEAKMKH